jgi:hypothetical protein
MERREDLRNLAIIVRLRKVELDKTARAKLARAARLRR